MHKLYNVIMTLLDFNRIQILSVTVYYRHATNVRILSSMVVLMLDILKEKNQNLKRIDTYISLRIDDVRMISIQNPRS